MSRKPQRILAAGASLLALAAGAAQADQVISDDLIVNNGSLCVGQDCVSGENFGFDTLRLKENNLRIHFNDTSNSGSFPTRDWTLIANDSGNGGANYFAIEDRDAGTKPFLVEADAGNNALYVDSTGYVGFGTSSPVVDLHVKQGNSPALRLEQDGSSGFSSQAWDIAGNETNFFIRDVTNSSKLPFKIKPGAPTNALFVAADGDIGLGTASPDAGLHMVTSSGLLVEASDSGTAAAEMLEIRGGNIRAEQAGPVNLTLDNTADSSNAFRIQVNDSARFSYVSTGIVEMELQTDGDLAIAGNFISNGTSLSVPDYVFEDSYELMPLSEVAAFIEDNGHLPRIPSAAEIARNGINHSEMQMSMLEKIEELTLYTLQQEEQIAALQQRLAEAN